MKHRWKIGASVIGIILIAAPQARSQIAIHSTAPQTAVGSGAVQTSNGTYLVCGTLGQGIIGNVLAGNGNAELGFWHQLARTAGESPATAIGTDGPALQATPNPFAGTTQVALQNSRHQLISLVLYNVLGQPVQTLINSEKPAGQLTVDINANELPSGRYTLILTAGNVQQMISLLLVK